MLVTGGALVGITEADDHPVSHTKIGVKLVVLVVILALVYLKRGERVASPMDRRLFGLVGALTAANIFIATVWT